MNDAEREALIERFERIAKNNLVIHDASFDNQEALKALHEIVFADTIDEADTRVLFCSPVTGVVGDVWGGAWWDASPYGKPYGDKQHIHTGADLNLSGFADAGRPVYATADGEIVFAGIVTDWQQSVVVIKHTLEDGSHVWTRYAHIRDVPIIGQVRVMVKRGEPIGVIADYSPHGKPEGDHLHYDIARIDLGEKHGDWPGLDKARVLRDYLDPAKLHRERSK